MFNVFVGDVYVLLGGNGVGKLMMLLIFFGFLLFDFGIVIVLGESVDGNFKFIC